MVSPLITNDIIVELLKAVPEDVSSPKLLASVMETIEKLRDAIGDYKVEYLHAVLVELSNSNMIPPKISGAAKFLTENEGLIRDTIDVISDASKGKFDINKIKTETEEIATCCFGYLKKVRGN